IVARLWVPCSHSLVARHLKRAASGVAVSASRAPSSAATFTPLSTVAVVDGFMVAADVMVVLLWGGQIGGQPERRSRGRRCGFHRSKGTCNAGTAWSDPVLAPAAGGRLERQD